MATYAELLTAFEDAELRKKIRVAVVVAAEIVRTEASGGANSANRRKWAKEVFLNPTASIDAIVWAVLAANRTAPLAAILAASDATVQTAVNAAVDVFAQG
jgi:nucleoid-associated protein YgaU